MVGLWMPGAARHPVGNVGAMDGGPPRTVWHITSNTTDWNFENELAYFTSGGAGEAPHLIWDPFTGQIAQLFPADSRSLSLKNAGSVRTNRTGAYCIQIEVVFTQNEVVNGRRYATVRGTPCVGLGRIVAWLRSLGVPDVWPGGAPTGFVRDTVPMDTWLHEGGHYGHSQVPGNDHVDPGPMPDLFGGAMTGCQGQDWASYQPANPATTGLSFAFTKVTEGLSYVNPLWVQQRDHAKANGLVWGGYHYPHMGNSVQAEADFFLGQVSWKPGDLIALDWEGYDSANQGVSRTQQAAYKESWLRYVKGRMPGHRVGMYCDTDYWHNVDTTGYAGDFLWIADPNAPMGDPGIKAPWIFHQYGERDGLDLDYCNLSAPALRAWAAGANPSPAPEVDVQLTDSYTVHKGNWSTGDQTASVGDWLAYGNLKAGVAAASAIEAAAGVKTLVAQVGAANAAIAALAKALTTAGGITAEQVQAAAEAGAKAALAELGHALDGTATPTP